MIKYMSDYSNPFQPKPIEKVKNDISSIHKDINKMKTDLISIRADISIIKDFIKEKQAKEEISKGWLWS
jgi:ferritin